MIRLLLSLYPSRWRERYEEEFRLMLHERGGRLRPTEIIDVISGAAAEWRSEMTPKAHRNDQAQRTATALAQAAAAVMIFNAVITPFVVSLFQLHSFGAPTFVAGVIWGAISGLLWSAVTLGPVAFVSASLDWDVPHGRVVAGVLTGLLSYRVASHIAWGPTVFALVFAAIWIGTQSVGSTSLEQATA